MSSVGLLPATFGKYELLERIGSGGMAEVYRARQPGAMGFEKICVIKRILPHLAQQPEIANMLIEEAKLAARVQHRNVVQIYDLGALPDGELYIAMEYVAGTDLQLLLQNSIQRRLKIPLWFTLHVLSEVLAGLACVHELVDDYGRPLRVVHRDVTPSNLFISYGGDIKLGDFGVAQSSGSASAPRPGQMRGKVSYMAPEQIRGETLDGRADVFAAGVVLWECFTQRRLFGGRSEKETIDAIIGGKRAAPSAYNARVTAELDRVVLRCLEPDPARRFQSAAELQESLAGILGSIVARVLQADVRYAVEVILGRVSPDARSGPLGAPVREEKKAEPETGGMNRTFFELPALKLRPYQLPAGVRSIPPAPPAQSAYVPTTDAYQRPAGSVPESEIDPQVPQFDTADIDGIAAFDLEEPDLEEELEIDIEVDDGHARHSLGADRSGAPAIFTAPPWAPGARATPQVPAKYDGGYRGPNPFWLQNEGQMIWGPCDYSVVCAYLSQAARTGLRIAAFETPWVDVEVFAHLSGQERLQAPAGLPRDVNLHGSLRSRSLCSVLGGLAAARSTGRLVIEGEDPKRPPRRELHIRDGLPIYLATDAPTLQLPDLLQRRGMLTPEDTPKLMHEVLYRLEPIEDVAARTVKVEVDRNYQLMMRERANELFSWRSGALAFEGSFVPVRGRPITSSLLKLAIDALGVVKSDLELFDAIATSMEYPLRARAQLIEEIQKLQLAPEQTAVAVALAKGTTVSQLLDRGGDPRATALIAHVMMEFGLLSP